MRLESLLEEISLLSSSLVGILHGLDPGNRFSADSAAGLGTTMLELADLSRLVGGVGDAMHLEVSELDNHLDVGIGRALELLDQALAVSLVVLDVKSVLANQLLKVLFRGFDGLVNSSVEGKVELLGSLQGRRDLGRAVINLVLGQASEDIVVQAAGGGTVHGRVLFRSILRVDRL
jgi:hypothetical protein